MRLSPKKTILPFVDKTNIVVQANHGTVSWGPTPERAYWLTELLDAYCRILLISRDLGRVDYFNKTEAEELLALKQQWHIDDPRIGMQNCELCANDVFRESWKETGVGHRAFQPPTFQSGDNSTASRTVSSVGNASGDVDQEALVQAITERVLAALNHHK